MEDRKRGERSLSIRPMLYEYVGKSKLSWVVVFMLITYGMQLLVSLENFTVLAIVGMLGPVLVAVALLRFYSCNQVKYYSKGSLDFLIILCKFLFVLGIISAVTLAFASITALSQGLNLLVIFMLFATGVVVTSFLAYHASAEALLQMRDMYEKEVIRVDRFEIAQRRWSLYAGLNLITVGLSYYIQEQYKNEMVATGKKMVDLGDWSIVVGVVSNLFAITLPFLWVILFSKAQDGFLQIRKDFVHASNETRESVQNDAF